MSFFGPTGGGGGVSIVHQKSVTLTNDQIIHLPTAPVEIVSAPGVSKVTLLQRAVAQSNVSGGNYTNLSEVNPFMYLGFIGGGRVSDNLYASILLTDQSTTTPLAVFSTGHDLDAGGSPPALITSNVLPSADGNVDSYANLPLGLFAPNVAADFGGGNASNSMLVGVSYMIYNLLTGAFE